LASQFAPTSSSVLPPAQATQVNYVSPTVAATNKDNVAGYNGAITPIIKYAQDNLDYYSNRALGDYDPYGGYYNIYNGVSSAAMLDPEVAEYFNGGYSGSGAYDPYIQKKIDTMNSLYKDKGWDGLLQNVKDGYVNNAHGGLQNAYANPNKKVSDGTFFEWSDLKTVAALAAVVFGGGSLAAGAMGGGAAGAAGAAGAGEAAAAGGAAAGGAAAGGAGVGAGAAAGGLVADAAIPTVVVTGSAGGAGGLGGLGALGAAGAGAVGLGSMMGGGGVDPNVPQVNVTGHPEDPGVHIPEGDLPVLIPPVLNPLDPDKVKLPADGMAKDPNTGGVVGGGGTPGGGVPNLPGGIKPGDVLGGLGGLYSGYQDYKMNQADMSYYQGLLNKMMGMYQPGTPEEELMRKQMEAKDAAAGRNSQYGVRSQNLASQLAAQRAQIMTSPTFAKIAEASRGHYDSSLASLSSLFGQGAANNSALNNLINTGINSGASWLQNLFS
jgi:hypothetical protein